LLRQLLSKSWSISLNKVLIISIIFCVPYFIYTYNLTNKYFYLSNAGGLQLYWMTVNDTKLRGDWNGVGHYQQNNPNLATKEYNNHIKEKYWSFWDDKRNLNWIEHDSVLKQISLENILNNKFNFFKNWINNFGRLFFGYPFSFHTPNWQHILITIKQSFYLPFIFSMIFIGLFKFKKFNHEFQFIYLLVIVYIGGISLMSAYPRFLFVLNPLIWTLGAFFFKNLKISLNDE